MTANAFSSVSLNPPLVLVCVEREARTHAHLHARKRFGVNVLAADQRSISECYARASEIAEVEDVVVKEGAPLLFFRGKYRCVGGEILPAIHEASDGSSGKSKAREQSKGSSKQ